MADHVAGLNTPASSPSPRVTELLALCADDYKSAAPRRTTRQDDTDPVPFAPAIGAPLDEPLYGTAADEIRDQLREPNDLAVAIRVGQKMLAAYGDSSGFDVFGFAQAHGGLAEALRIMLRALGAEAGENQ